MVLATVSGFILWVAVKSVLFGHAGAEGMRDELAQLTSADEMVEVPTREQSDEL